MFFAETPEGGHKLKHGSEVKDCLIPNENLPVIVHVPLMMRSISHNQMRQITVIYGGLFLACKLVSWCFEPSQPHRITSGPHLRGFWDKVGLFILRACFFLLKVEISSCTLIPFFRSGSVHSGLASWDDCGRLFPDELCVSSFPDRFLHYAWTAAWSAHSDFVGSRVYACLDVTCSQPFPGVCLVRVSAPESRSSMQARPTWDTW